MMKSITGFLNLRREVKKTVRETKAASDKIKQAVGEIMLTLNGEDRWFLRVCDSKSDTDKDCDCTTAKR